MHAKRMSLCLTGLLAASFLIGTAGAQTTVTDDEGRSEEIHEIGIFHPAPGAQITYDLCTTCHSEMIIAQQGQTREGWDDILVWMVEEMGMAELAEDEREQVLDYLAEYYNPDRPHFPRN
ncbi:MAG: aldehyde dehydrogenase [Roseicyclus sp.]